MKKMYFKCIALFLCIVLTMAVLPSCNHKTENEFGEEEENDKYDSPEIAAQFETFRRLDVATGKVPYRRFWDAILETNALKNVTPNSTSSSNALAPLTWVERGSNSDAVGPSNGNTRAGNEVTSGRMRAVWVDLADATGKTVWVGGVSGGLWKTNDISTVPATWTLVNDYLSNLAIASICQDPTNTNIMYFSTGESYRTGGGVGGVGVFKSIDHGVTWNLLTSPAVTVLVNSTKILCDNVGNVYVNSQGISIAAGLQRSSDGGNTWVSINPFTTGPSATSRIIDFEISSTGAMHIVGGFYDSAPGVGGYRYTSNPATATSSFGWNTPTTLYPIPTTGGARVEITTAGNTIYAAISNADKIDIVGKSIDGGNNWTTTNLTATNITDLNGAGGQGTYSNTIGVDPSNPNNVIVGSLNLLKSVDGGITFTKLTTWVGFSLQYLHADQHDITWYDNGNKMLVGSDGGLFYSTNKGANFLDKNVGLRLKQFYGVTIHPTSTNYFLAGAQDNGTHQFNGAGLTSSIEVLGGDGGFTGIDQDEPQFQSGAYVYANFRRSSNSGATWSSSGNANSSGLFINPYDYDNVGNKVYAGYAAGQFLRWEDPHSAFTFTPVSVPEFGTGTVTSTTVSPTVANRVYFGVFSSKVFKLDNADLATPTVTDISPTGIQASTYITCVAEGLASNQNLIATQSRTTVGFTHVWSSSNGGTSWVACDGNLPNIPVYWAIYHPDADTKAYIATETGVWSTDLLNGASTVWTPESTFPTVKTSMLKYRASDRTIAAATYGRGLWTATIPNGSCTPASISSQPVNATICAGANTSFSVTAAGSPTLTYQWQVSTAGSGGPWTNLTNVAPYSNVTTATLNITAATVSLNTYQYRVIVTGNCAPLTATSNAVLLTVNAATTLTLTSVAGTNNQTVNTNTSITNITYTTSNGVTGATITGLPAGVTGTYAGGTNGGISIAGTPTVAGTFTYTVTTSGGCAVQTATGTITVATAPTLTLSSAAGTNTQTVCINTAITNIVYSSAGGVTGATITGLPTGVTGTYAAGVFTISGTPTVTGTFSYTVTSSGGTPNATATGTITVSASTTLTLTSAVGTALQTVTVNSPITNITYSTSGGVTGATITGLPAGVTGTYSGGTNGGISISGTPTVVGTFSYTVTTSGGCAVQTTTGSITTVNGPSITLTSAAGTNNQSVCVNAAITNIVYTAAGGVTGATVAGLPAGVTGSYSGGTNGTFTITGTATATGTFNYTVTTSGGSSVATSTGTITVNSGVTLTLTSAAATTTQTININIAIANITYSTTSGVTGATVTGLPAGVTGVYSGGTNGTVTISGTPTAAGTFIYNVTTSGGCDTQIKTGTITVTIPPSIVLTSTAGTNAQTLCIGNSITAITYTTAGGITGATTTGLPAGVIGTYSGGTNGTYTISGTPTTTGTFNYTITTSGAVLTATGSIIINALPAAPTVTAVTYCQGATATSLTAGGTGLLWYLGVTGGPSSATAPTPLTTTVGNTTYYVSQTVNGCESPRAAIVVTVNITPAAPTATSPISYCQGGTATALIATGSNLKWYTTSTGITPLPAAPTPLTTTAGSTIYYVSQTTGICESPRLAITVNVSAGPAITAQPTDITSCSTTATFNVTASGTTLTYQWQVSTDGGITYGNITGATNSTYTVSGLTPAQANNKYRAVVSAAGCSSVTSNAATAKVGTAPMVVLTVEPNVNFNPSINGGVYAAVSPVGNYTYQWKRNNNILPLISSASITKANGLLDEFGTYQVTVFDVATGCSGVSNIVTVSDIVGERNKLFISPNPTRGMIKLSYYSSNTAAQGRSVNVYDSRGAKVITKDFTVSGNYGSTELDLTKMREGTYLIVLRDASGKKIASDRVIKY